MRTHPSNYRIEGFVAEVDAASMAALAKELGVLSFEDLGTGALIDLAPYGLAHEPTLAEEIAAGVDLVAVSGDKLLGGPQCGIIVGKTPLIAAMKRNALLRALRVDKMTLAALSATLAKYLAHDRLDDLPLFAMLKASQSELLARASRLCEQVGARLPEALRPTPAETVATTGGGTLPLCAIPSAGVSIKAAGRTPSDLAARLRRGRPPVVARVENDALIIDLRTVFPREDAILADLLVDALAGAPACE
jgi:L-seryl-tRNA(Ser) seleniumtransferase